MNERTASPCSVRDPGSAGRQQPAGPAQISYRVDDFTGFRRALLRPLPGEQAIGAWRPGAGRPRPAGTRVVGLPRRHPDLLQRADRQRELPAHRHAAGQRRDLVALLGYQPAPASPPPGTLAAIRSAAHPAEPLVIPAGMRLSSVATPGVAAQTFEVDAAASFTGPSSVPVTLVDTLADPTAHHEPAGRAGPSGSATAAAGRAGLTGVMTTGRWSPWPRSRRDDPGTGAVNTLVTFSAGAGGQRDSTAFPTGSTVGPR